MSVALAPSTFAAPVATFLARHGQNDAQLASLPGPSGPRTFVRLLGKDLLLLEDRSDPVGIAAYIRLSRHLNRLGLSAPRVIGADPVVGLALIEDFGTETLGKQISDGHDPVAPYELAIDTLVHLHSAAQATDVTVRGFDVTRLLDTVSSFSRRFVPSIAPTIDVAGFDKAFRCLWLRALAPLENAPKALVLQGFRLNNLMRLEARQGVAACGLLEFQDAMLGPAEFDLVSLLHSEGGDLGKRFEQTLLRRYLDAVPATCGSRDEITQRYHLLAAHRLTSLLGDPPHMPTPGRQRPYPMRHAQLTHQLQAALQRAQLAEISDFIDTTLPGWRDAGPAMAAPL